MKKGLSSWLSGVNKYWSKKKDSVLEIGAKIKNKASELWSGFKKDWKSGKEKAAEFKRFPLRQRTCGKNSRLLWEIAKLRVSY